MGIIYIEYTRPVYCSCGSNLIICGDTGGKNIRKQFDQNIILICTATEVDELAGEHTVGMKMRISLVVFAAILIAAFVCGCPSKKPNVPTTVSQTKKSSAEAKSDLRLKAGEFFLDYKMMVGSPVPSSFEVAATATLSNSGSAPVQIDKIVECFYLGKILAAKTVLSANDNGDLVSDFSGSGAANYTGKAGRTIVLEPSSSIGITIASDNSNFGLNTGDGKHKVTITAEYQGVVIKTFTVPVKKITKKIN